MNGCLQSLARKRENRCIAFLGRQRADKTRRRSIYQSEMLTLRKVSMLRVRLIQGRSWPVASRRQPEAMPLWRCWPQLPESQGGSGYKARRLPTPLAEWGISGLP